MTKQAPFLLIALLLAACSHNPKAVLGTWQVSDPYYTARYELAEVDGQLSAEVLYYNDGTQRYNASGNQHRYLSSNLKWNDGVYIDGVSGATNTSKTSARITIEQVHTDTLEVRYAEHQSPAVERWVRIINHQH